MCLSTVTWVYSLYLCCVERIWLNTQACLPVLKTSFILACVVFCVNFCVRLHLSLCSFIHSSGCPHGYVAGLALSKRLVSPLSCLCSFAKNPMANMCGQPLGSGSEVLDYCLVETLGIRWGSAPSPPLRCALFNSQWSFCSCVVGMPAFLFPLQVLGFWLRLLEISGLLEENGWSNKLNLTVYDSIFPLVRSSWFFFLVMFCCFRYKGPVFALF